MREGEGERKIRALGEYVYVRHARRSMKEGSLYVPPMAMRIRAEKGEARVPGLTQVCRVLSVGEKVKAPLSEGDLIIVDDAAGVSSSPPFAFYKEGDVLLKVDLNE